MTPSGLDRRTLDAACADCRAATAVYDGAVVWLQAAVKGRMDPIAAEVWVLDPDLEHVLLVNHRWRGWVPPGGVVEPGETPREAAGRELLEETGLRADLLEIPAAVTVRSYRSDWTSTLGLSYATIADRSLPVTGESYQPVAWVPLGHDWESVFPDDRTRVREFARQLSSGPVIMPLR